MMRYKYVTLDSNGKRWERIIGEGEFTGYLGLAGYVGSCVNRATQICFTRAWIEAVSI